MAQGPEWSWFITIFAAVFSTAGGIYAVLLKLTFSTHQTATDRRFQEIEKKAIEDEKTMLDADRELRASREIAVREIQKAKEESDREFRRDVKDLTARCHSQEVQYLTMQGDMRVLTAGHARSQSDIQNIHDNMVTRDEWEPRTKHLETTVDTILRELRAGSHRSGGSTPRYPAVDPLNVPR